MVGNASVHAGCDAVPGPEGLSRHGEAFLEMMVVERGASLNTRNAYKRDLEAFGTRVALIGAAIEAADTEMVRAHMAALGKSGRTQATMARSLSALRQFFSGFSSPKAFVPTIRVPVWTVRAVAVPLPKILSESEVERLLAAARSKPGWRGTQLVALVEILYATGLRVF